MTALVNGYYDLMPLPDPNLGPRKLDVASNIQHRALPPHVREQAEPTSVSQSGLVTRTSNRDRTISLVDRYVSRLSLRHGITGFTTLRVVLIAVSDAEL
jgi:hypothetical protein